MSTRREFLSQISSMVAVAGVSPMIAACCSYCPEKSKRPFKLGVADWSLRMGGDPMAFDKAKELGLDGVQVSMAFDPKSTAWGTSVRLAEVKAAMARTGLECASTAPMLNKDPFLTTDTAIEYTINAIKAAHDFGAKDILMPFYGNANLQDKSTKRIKEECFKPLVKRLKMITPIAEKLGVAIGMENSLNAEDDIRIIEAVGSPALKVYFDIMNFQYYGFETVPEMKKLKGYINQIHIKDIGHTLDSKSGMPRDVNACLDTIAEIEYDGWLVLETHGHNPKKHGPLEDVLKNNMAYLKKSVLWK